jgi:hypothetical protein
MGFTGDKGLMVYWSEGGWISLTSVMIIEYLGRVSCLDIY